MGTKWMQLVDYGRLATHCIEGEGTVCVGLLVHLGLDFHSGGLGVGHLDPFNLELAVVCSGLEHAEAFAHLAGSHLGRSLAPLVGELEASLVELAPVAELDVELARLAAAESWR